jgi:hypothetical protein
MHRKLSRDSKGMSIYRIRALPPVGEPKADMHIIPLLSSPHATTPSLHVEKHASTSPVVFIIYNRESLIIYNLVGFVRAQKRLRTPSWGGRAGKHVK